MARHIEPRAAIGRPVKTVAGVLPGGAEHRLLLALRGPGGMTPEQIQARFGHVSASLHRLKQKGLISIGSHGQKGFAASVTDTGRALTEAGAPLSRSHLITYCQF